MPLDESGFIEGHRSNPTDSDRILGLSSNGIVYRTGTNAYSAGNLSGDVTTSALVATLANTAVTAGNYTINSKPAYTVDTKGRLTAASNVSLSIIDIGSTVGSGNIVLGSSAQQSWTPTLSPASGSFNTVTYSTQYGRYSQIGNIVFWHFDIVLSAFNVGTASGILFITGLPTASIGGGNQSWIGDVIVSNVTYSGDSLKCVVSGGISGILLVGCTSASSTSIVQAGNLSASANIYCSGWYLIS